VLCQYIGESPPPSGGGLSAKPRKKFEKGEEKKGKCEQQGRKDKEKGETDVTSVKSKQKKQK
jgi:hypothetical protein